MNDPVVQKTELVIDALQYAHDHNLDINIKDNVKKILEVIDPEHSTDEDTEEFIKLLQATNALIESDVKRRRSIN